MPCNDHITRQWHLLRELESPRGKTHKELVNALPRDSPRHERTVRRDLESLEAAGVPLLTETINGQVRWRFMDGYRNKVALGISLAASLRQAVRQKAKAIADQPEDIKGRLLEISPKRKRRA